MRGPLSAEAVRAALQQPQAGRVLPVVHLPLIEEVDGLRAVECYLLHVRDNGFMIVIPGIL